MSMDFLLYFHRRVSNGMLTPWDAPIFLFSARPLTKVWSRATAFSSIAETCLLLLSRSPRGTRVGAHSTSWSLQISIWALQITLSKMKSWGRQPFSHMCSVNCLICSVKFHESTSIPRPGNRSLDISFQTVSIHSHVFWGSTTHNSRIQVARVSRFLSSRCSKIPDNISYIEIPYQVRCKNRICRIKDNMHLIWCAPTDFKRPNSIYVWSALPEWIPPDRSKHTSGLECSKMIE